MFTYVKQRVKAITWVFTYNPIPLLTLGKSFLVKCVLDVECGVHPNQERTKEGRKGGREGGRTRGKSPLMVFFTYQALCYSCSHVLFNMLRFISIEFFIEIEQLKEINFLGKGKIIQ